MRKFSKGRTTRAAQSLVEMTLITPVLIVLLCTVFEFGWAYLTLSSLNNASIAGARVAAAGGNEAAVTAAVSAARGIIANPQVHISVATNLGLPVPDTDRTNYNYIKVRVSTPYASISGLIDFQRIVGLNEYSSENTLLIFN